MAPKAPKAPLGKYDNMIARLTKKGLLNKHNEKVELFKDVTTIRTHLRERNQLSSFKEVHTAWKTSDKQTPIAKLVDKTVKKE